MQVHATKPQASREESAEIFVVCQNFIAPGKIDPKFLDPKHVFAEIDLEPTHKLNVFNPEKQKKAKAIGYPENDYTLYHRVSVKDFIASESAVEGFQNVSEIVIDDEGILNHKKTTKEVIECCKDIKVLGKKDFRLLMNWWKVLKDEFGEKKKADESEEKIEEKPLTLEEQEDLEDEQIQGEIEKLKEEKVRELKRKKKRENKEKQKIHQKLNLKMINKGDEGPTLEADDMFTLKQIHTLEDLQCITDQSPDVVAESDEDEDEAPKPKLVRYEKGEGHLDSKSLFYKDEDSELEFSDDDTASEKSGLALSDAEEEEVEKPKKSVTKRVSFQEDKEPEDEDDDDDDDDDDKNPLITDLDPRDKKSKKLAKAELFFDRDIFKGIEDNKLDDIEIDKMIEVHKKKGGIIIGDNDKVKKENDKNKSKHDDDDSDTDEDDKDSGNDSDYNVNEELKPQKKGKKVGGKAGFEVVSADKRKFSN